MLYSSAKNLRNTLIPMVRICGTEMKFDIGNSHELLCHSMTTSKHQKEHKISSIFLMKSST